MDTVQDMVDIGTAAIRMGIAPEAVRKRIGRGSVPATKQEAGGTSSRMAAWTTYRTRPAQPG